jgi:hypothetical protein
MGKGRTAIRRSLGSPCHVKNHVSAVSAMTRAMSLLPSKEREIDGTIKEKDKDVGKRLKVIKKGRW